MSLHNYKIWTNDGLIEKENAREMRHVDPQAAVEEFAEEYDLRGGYYFAQYSGRTTIFVEDEEGCVTKWTITVGSNPQYYATEIKSIPCCDSPDKDKCDQCQEIGLADPTNH